MLTFVKFSWSNLFLKGNAKQPFLPAAITLVLILCNWRTKSTIAYWDTTKFFKRYIYEEYDGMTWLMPLLSSFYYYKLSSLMLRWIWYLSYMVSCWRCVLQCSWALYLHGYLRFPIGTPKVAYLGCCQCTYSRPVKILASWYTENCFYISSEGKCKVECLFYMPRLFGKQQKSINRLTLQQLMSSRVAQKGSI